jgi:5'-nucleotidase
MIADKIIQAVSTSVLFDMREPDRIFRERGNDAYIKYMLETAEEPLPLSHGFDTLKGLLQGDEHMDFIICSRNSPITSRRALYTLGQEGITPEGVFFTSGRSPVPFLHAYGVHQFKTTNKDDAYAARENGIMSSYYDPEQNEDIVSPESKTNVVPMPRRRKNPQLKPVFLGQTKAHYVFDLDGVVFDDESERFFREHGLESYRNFEAKLMKHPMNKGIAYDMLKKCHDINQKYSGHHRPFDISVVTARGNIAAVRAIETLHQWGIDIDGYMHCLAGKSKEPILRALKEISNGTPIEFFDDQPKYIQQGRDAGILSGHVLGGVDTPKGQNPK